MRGLWALEEGDTRPSSPGPWPTRSLRPGGCWAAGLFQWEPKTKAEALLLHTRRPYNLKCRSCPGSWLGSSFPAEELPIRWVPRRLH